MTHHCIACGTPYTPGANTRRPALYCSNACRKRAHRQRNAVVGAWASLELCDRLRTKRNNLVTAALVQSRQDMSARQLRIAELAAVARDSTLDRETRLLAVMTLTSMEWKRRQRVKEGREAAEEREVIRLERAQPVRDKLVPDGTARSLGEAKATRASRYFGKPCRYGHMSGERYTNNQTCVECVRLRVAASNKKSGQMRANKVA